MTITLPIIIALAGYFVFAAAVGAMWPPTEEQKAGFYGWLYRFLQRCAANADRVVEARFPGIAAPDHVGEESVERRLEVASSTSITRS